MKNVDLIVAACVADVLRSFLRCNQPLQETAHLRAQVCQLLQG